jgi:hypothetical protein
VAYFIFAGRSKSKATLGPGWARLTRLDRAVRYSINRPLSGRILSPQGELLPEA